MASHDGIRRISGHFGENLVNIDVHLVRLRSKRMSNGAKLSETQGKILASAGHSRRSATRLGYSIKYLRQLYGKETALRDRLGKRKPRRPGENLAARALAIVKGALIRKRLQ